VNLNVGNQIQLWRVTTFHKIHCVIDYTIVVIDYQWIVLKKKLRVITLNIIFSKVITLPMVFFYQTWRVYKSKTLARILQASKKHISLSNLFWPLPIVFSLQKLLPKMLSKLWFQNFVFPASGNSAENKSVLSFLPSPSCQKNSKDEPPENSFDFSFSLLLKEFKGLTACDIFCFPLQRFKGLTA